MEEDGINPWTFVLLGIAMLYLTASPGVLQGFIDQYIIATFNTVTKPLLTQKDVEIGKKLAVGGFGTVYLGKATATVPGQVRKGQVSPLLKRARRPPPPLPWCAGTPYLEPKVKLEGTSTGNGVRQPGCGHARRMESWSMPDFHDD
jgi:hypothetical protein